MRKLCVTFAALFLLISSLTSCADGEQNNGSINNKNTTTTESSSFLTTEDALGLTKPTATESGTCYRSDLYWGGAHTYSNTAKLITPSSSTRDSGLLWLAHDDRYAFQIQYNLFEYTAAAFPLLGFFDDKIVTKSFIDFTDSDEDLAFYNAEVEYFESLGIEVLKDHRCANSTPGQTNGIVPALVVAMNKEQYDNLVPRLNNEFYCVNYAVYAFVAPSDTPDLLDMQKEEEVDEWQLDSHPYRSDVFWVDDEGFIYSEVKPGEKRVSVYYTHLLSPSDRMALSIGIGLYDYEAAEAQDDPQYVIQKYRSYLESLGIEIWEDVLPDPNNLRGSIVFYASVTPAQLEGIEILEQTAQSYDIYSLHYEQFMMMHPELAG